MTSLSSELFDYISQKISHQNFTDEEEEIFVNSFKYSLKYGNDNTQFIISLEDIYNWIGFSRIDNAKVGYSYLFFAFFL